MHSMAYTPKSGQQGVGDIPTDPFGAPSDGMAQADSRHGGPPKPTLDELEQLLHDEICAHDCDADDMRGQSYGG